MLNSLHKRTIWWTQISISISISASGKKNENVNVVSLYILNDFDRELNATSSFNYTRENIKKAEM